MTTLRTLLAFLALLLAPALHAITVREGIEITDFPNSAASSAGWVCSASRAWIR